MIAAATEWRPVAGFEDRYEVSDVGQLRSTRTGRLSKTRIDKRTGYPTGQMFRNGLRKDVFMHSVVAAAFIGPRPAGHQVNHKNGIKTDCRPENLEYVTPSENTRHAHATGLTNPQPGSRKLTDQQVVEIIGILAARHISANRKPTFDEIGKQCGVSEYAIYQIDCGKTYRRLSHTQPLQVTPLLAHGTTMIYHIRKPTAKKGRVSIHHAKSRTAATYCGEPATEHDIRHSWKYADTVGDYVPCAKCVALREAAKKESTIVS
jgi:hypothetical protein